MGVVPCRVPTSSFKFYRCSNRLRENMRRLRLIFVAVCLGLNMSVLCPAFEGKSSKQILNNGLTVLVTEMPVTPVVSVYALVKTGSATEGEFLGTGISHFFEHMLFKGTKTRAVGQIATQIQAVGGSINASTGKDYTIYTITVPYDAFDLALDILADMLMNSSMDPQEVEKERQVIFGEMRMNNDQPDRYLGELAYLHAYIRHPYRHPVIGYETLLAGVTREDLVDYYQTHYTPNNTILSIAGNISTRDILPKIKETFKEFKRGKEILRNLPDEPEQISARRYEETYPTDLTRMSLMFRGVRLLDNDLTALDVLAMILGQGESSRLYGDVYKKKNLVHAISASNYTPMDRGLFEIESLLEEKNVDATIDACWKQMDVIKKDGVKKQELEKAKRQVLRDFIFSRQTTSHVAHSQALDEAYAGDYQFSRKYVEAIRQVTGADVQRAAQRYLTQKNSTLVILRPQKETGPEVSQDEQAMPGEIVKHTLANGLTVLLREDHTFPIVAIHFVMNGGLRVETDELNGISKMTAAMWTKGTKSLSAVQIAQKTESLGISLGGFSGKNSLGLSASFLGEDLDAGLSLLADAVNHPTFPEEELLNVKEDTRSVIRRREDNISRFTGQAVKQLLFLKHPYRLEEEGSLASVDRITRGDILKFYQKYAVANNIVLSVFGDIQPEDVLRRVKKDFGSLASNSVSLTDSNEEPLTEPRETQLMMEKEQAMVMMGFQGVMIKDEDRYGLDILASILGSSFSGRLFNSIREELGQAYTLGGYSVPGMGAGYLVLYVLTSDDKLSDVRTLLEKEITRLQTDLVPDQELADMKTYLKGDFKTEHETNAALSFTSSLDELYGLGFNDHKNYDEYIDKVTKEDIQHLARMYLDLKKAVVVLTRPRKASEKTGPSSLEETGTAVK